MSRAWKQGLLSLPGIGLSALPKLACPVCWPAYAGLLIRLALVFSYQLRTYCRSPSRS